MLGTFGVPTRTVETDAGRVIIVQLGPENGGDVALDEREFVDLFDGGQVNDAGSFRMAVLAVKQRKAEEWARNRGPDSALGRGVESGTPPTDHSSEPQA